MGRIVVGFRHFHSDQQLSDFVFVSNCQHRASPEKECRGSPKCWNCGAAWLLQCILRRRTVCMLLQNLGSEWAGHASNKVWLSLKIGDSQCLTRVVYSVRVTENGWIGTRSRFGANAGIFHAEISKRSIQFDSSELPRKRGRTIFVPRFFSSPMTITDPPR